MKASRFILLAALALPMVAEAQGQPAALPPNPNATVFKNRTTGARNNIAQALDSIPANLFNFKPTEKQLTVGYVAQHVADDNYFFCSNFSDKKPTRTAAETSTPDSVKAKWPKDSLVAQLRRANAFCDEVMATMDDAAVTAIITVTNPQTGATRQAPRMAYLVGHAMDLADHYSQLANYMRINGLIPPTALPRPGRGGN